MAETEHSEATGPSTAELLAGAELEILGLLPGSSNYTFLARLIGAGEALLAVYKPQRGESPLWDFPEGTLCKRETAAYLVSAAAGWDHIPPTVLRDGPHGLGAVQLFCDHDPEVTAFDLLAGHPERLRALALFDLVANNADRKAGHVLLGKDGRVWGIDHGLCFHADYKLRTVLWNYIGQPLTGDEQGSLEALHEALQHELEAPLGELLAPDEREAVRARTEALLQNPKFPEPGPGRPVPWPVV